VVPPAVRHEAREIEFKHILCPIDFGPSSMKALDYAVALASESLGILTVLHVLEPIRDDSLTTGFDADAWHADMLRDAKTRLHDVVTARTRPACHPIDLLTSGSPRKEILRVARAIGAQLVVMGVAGRGVVDRMIFGSTTNHVVRSAPCPVMTMREPAATHALETPATCTISE
jgi:nucleotide-binding universal stress UspA family protein